MADFNMVANPMHITMGRRENQGRLAKPSENPLGLVIYLKKRW